jgi:hypothetical protein
MQPPKQIVHWRLDFADGTNREFKTVGDVLRFIHERDGHCLISQSSFSTCARGLPKGVLRRLLGVHKISGIIRIKK